MASMWECQSHIWYGQSGTMADIYWEKSTISYWKKDIFSGTYHQGGAYGLGDITTSTYWFVNNYIDWDQFNMILRKKERALQIR